MSKLSKSFICNFTQVPNEIINDKRVSLKAKGLYLYFISKPDNWDFSFSGMASQLSESKPTISSIIDELCKFGYMTKIKSRNGIRQAVNSYELHQTPYFPPDSSFLNQKVCIRKSDSENLHTSNTNTSNKEISNTEKREEEEAKPFFNDLQSFLLYFRNNFTGIPFKVSLGNSVLEVFVNKSGFLINADSLKKISVGSAKDAYRRLFIKWDLQKPYFYQEFARLKLHKDGVEA